MGMGAPRWGREHLGGDGSTIIEDPKLLSKHKNYCGWIIKGSVKITEDHYGMLTFCLVYSRSNIQDLLH